jgi:thiol-disulfide isomerase/thioredoxin
MIRRRLGVEWGLVLGAWCAAVSLACVGCDGAKRKTAGEPERAGAASATAADAAPGPRRSTAGARFEEAPEGDEPVAEIVVRTRARVEAEGGRLIVAVGAPWCEPCRRFHDAVTAGKLDETVPGVVFLEFDHDRDAARLRADGYTSRLIPLYVIPDAAGRAPAATEGGLRMEGSIKGDGAVAEITPRLLRLLAAGRAR